MTEAPFELPKIIRLVMTDEDIASAECNSRANCVIARNIYRQLELPVGRVRVSTAGVSIAVGDYRYYYRVPKHACRQVEMFDRHEEVFPIVYRIRFTERAKIQPTSPERRSQINAARNVRESAAAAAGIPRRTYAKGRYGI